MIHYLGNAIGLPPPPAPRGCRSVERAAGGWCVLWGPRASGPPTGHAIVVAAPNLVNFGLL